MKIKLTIVIDDEDLAGAAWTELNHNANHQEGLMLQLDHGIAFDAHLFDVEQVSH